MFYPPIPKLRRENTKILFDAGIFVLTLSHNQWSITQRAETVDQTLPQWLSYWRLARALGMGSGSIQIASDTMTIDTTLPINAKISAIDPDDCSGWLTLCEQLGEVFSFAGIAEQPMLSLESIYQNAAGAQFAYGLLHPENGGGRSVFRSSCPDSVPDSLLLTSLHIDYLQFERLTIAYCGIGPIAGVRQEDKIIWTSESVSFVMAKQLRLPGDYEQFIEDGKRKTNCQNVRSRAHVPIAAGAK